LPFRVTLIPGDGIGPEVTSAARRVLEATGAPIEWEIKKAGEAALKECGELLPPDTLESIRENRVALKGPITTPVGTGFRSINVALRQELDLYANVRPFRTYPNAPALHQGVDLVIFRENTEDLYAGIEHMVGEEAAESIKIITRRASARIARAAFEYARRKGRRRVTAGHKANIMKLTDGLFLRTFYEVAREYPDVQADDKIVDNLAMQLVMRPQEYQVLVLPNLYGDILSDLCAGLVGGLGLAPGANIGEGAAIFEPVHGSAPDIAGKNRANPLATVLSGAMLLEHLGLAEAAQMVEKAVWMLLEEGRVLTPDLGGRASTQEVAQTLVDKIEILKGGGM